MTSPTRNTARSTPKNIGVPTSILTSHVAQAMNADRTIAHQPRHVLTVVRWDTGPAIVPNMQTLQGRVPFLVDPLPRRLLRRRRTPHRRLLLLLHLIRSLTVTPIRRWRNLMARARNISP